MEWSEKYGGIIRYHGLFNEPRVLVSDPELLKQVLVTNQYVFTKPKQLAEFIGRILGIGLLVAEVTRGEYEICLSASSKSTFLFIVSYSREMYIATNEKC
jgi:hypothetical protein